MNMFVYEKLYLYIYIFKELFMTNLSHGIYGKFRSLYLRNFIGSMRLILSMQITNYFFSILPLYIYMYAYVQLKKS